MRKYINSVPPLVLKLAGLGLVFVGAAHLSPLGADGSRAATAFRDAMHAPAFMLLTLGLLFGLSGRLTLKQSYITSVLFAAMAGVTGEAFQAIGPGDASISDLGSDGLGILAGTLLYAGLDSRIPFKKAPGLRLAVGVSALFITAAILSTPAKFAHSFYSRQDSVPTIYSPTAAWQGIFFGANYSATTLPVTCSSDWECTDNGLTRIVFSNREYSGIRLETAKNWKNYVFLNVPISSADGFQHRLTLSVNDGKYRQDYSDRFNYHFDVPIEPTILKIPISDIRESPSSRQMQMDNITNLYLFMDAPVGGEMILIGRIFLSTQ